MIEYVNVLYNRQFCTFVGGSSYDRYYRLGTKILSDSLQYMQYTMRINKKMLNGLKHQQKQKNVLLSIKKLYWT